MVINFSFFFYLTLSFNFKDQVINQESEHYIYILGMGGYKILLEIRIRKVHCNESD